MKKLHKPHITGFSLIELSVVILVIGIMVIGISSGSRIMSEAKIKSANSLTNSSAVGSLEGLALWLESVDKSNIATGSAGSGSYGNLNDQDLVANWKDRNPHSTNKIIVSATTDGKRPTYIKSGIGGLPTLQFTTSSLTELDSDVTPLSNGDKTYSMVVVWKPTIITAGSAYYVFSQCTTSSPNNKCGDLFIQTDGKYGFNGYNNNYNPITTVVNKEYITIITVNNELGSNNISIYSNSNTPVIGTNSGGSSSLDFTTQKFRVGSITTSTDYHFNGQVSEIIIFNRTLKTSEVVSVNEYLSKKYNIKLN